MTGATFAEAIAAAHALGVLVDPALPVVEDSMERFVREGAGSSPSSFMRPASEAAASGVAVTLDLTSDAASVRLATDRSGRWSLSGEVAQLLPTLGARQQRATWSTAEVLGDGGEEELDAAEEVRLRVEVHKPRWSDPIARETGRAVWIGPSTDGLVRWLSQSNPKAVVNSLFGGDHRGALLLLGDWDEDPVEAGARLTVGGLQARTPAPADPPTLTARLAERQDMLPLPHWRALDIEAATLPDAIRGPLTRLVAITATTLLAEETEPGRVRPAAGENTIWPDLPQTVGSVPMEAHAVVELTRWVAEDLSQARLDAARHVAATSILNPFTTADGGRIVEIAQTTYHLLVHADALASLDHQQKLEEAFHDLDAKADELRSRIGENLDAAVTKVLAAALAISIAALASPKVRNLPATIAAVILALYLAGNGWALLRWYKRDAESRLNAARATAAGRLKGVGIDLDQKAGEWLTDLRGRVTTAAVTLFVLATVLVLGGLAADAGVREELGIESAKPSSTGPHPALTAPASTPSGQPSSTTTPRTRKKPAAAG